MPGEPLGSAARARIKPVVGDADPACNTKLCRSCGKQKLISEFHRDKSRRDGHASSCKPCACNRARHWYKENQEKATTSRKLFYSINRRIILERMSLYRAANANLCSERNKQWRQANLERKRFTDQRWHKINFEKTKRYRVISEGRRRAAIAGERVSAACIIEIGKSQTPFEKVGLADVTG